MTYSHGQRVATAVRGALADKGKTQTDLAAHLGVTQQWVSRRLTGAVAFDIDELGQVADWLGVPVTTLLGAIQAAS